MASAGAGTAADQTWLSWLMTTNDVKQLWGQQPTYILSQVHFLILGLITFVHAMKQGGRWPWLWFATVVHGVWTDNFWHFVLPEMDNFWHSQTPIMFLGARLPLHIIFLYPAFLYPASVAISRLRLPLIAEMAAVGLLTVAIDLPYDIVSVKFVHWTWHATDPNILDRLYYVPWNSLYFHATFAASFYGIFQGLRRWLVPNIHNWQSAGFKTEFKVFLATSFLSMPLGVIMFAVLYHPLHDSFGVHSEITFWTLASIFISIVLTSILNNLQPRDPKCKASKMDYILLGQLFVHYALFWSLTVWGSPENEISTGLHQTVGPCDAVESLTTPFGQTLWKGKYLCIDYHQEEYFDLHCTGYQVVKPYTSWYTICGTHFSNRVEYITLISAITIFSLPALVTLFRRGADDFANIRAKQKKH